MNKEHKSKPKRVICFIVVVTDIDGTFNCVLSNKTFDTEEQALLCVGGEALHDAIHGESYYYHLREITEGG